MGWLWEGGGGRGDGVCVLVLGQNYLPTSGKESILNPSHAE